MRPMIVRLFNPKNTQGDHTDDAPFGVVEFKAASVADVCREARDFSDRQNIDKSDWINGEIIQGNTIIGSIKYDGDIYLGKSSDVKIAVYEYNDENITFDFEHVILEVPNCSDVKVTPFPREAEFSNYGKIRPSHDFVTIRGNQYTFSGSFGLDGPGQPVVVAGRFTGREAWGNTTTQGPVLRAAGERIEDAVMRWGILTEAWTMAQRNVSNMFAVIARKGLGAEQKILFDAARIRAEIEFNQALSEQAMRLSFGAPEDAGDVAMIMIKVGSLSDKTRKVDAVHCARILNEILPALVEPAFTMPPAICVVPATDQKDSWVEFELEDGPNLEAAEAVSGYVANLLGRLEPQHVAALWEGATPVVKPARKAARVLAP